MKRMHNTVTSQKSNKITIHVDKSKVRNELHFNACLNSNVAYIEKNKKKVIPRKQKYKSLDD